MKTSTETLKIFFKNIKPYSYLEIGVRYAQTINVLSKFCKIVHGIDPDPECESYITENKIKFFNITSDDFFKNYNYSYDCIFIDGLHTKEQVLKDFYNSIERLNKGGWIFIHDTYPNNIDETKSNMCGTVFQAIPLIKQHLDLEYYEFITLPWAYGITCIHELTNNINQYKQLEI